MKKLKTLFVLTSLFILCISINKIYGKNCDVDLKSRCAILYDAENDNTLFEKNCNQRASPASTTKILTAILSIENLNLTDTVTVSSNAVNSTPIGSSTINLKINENISIKDLLYGLMIKSGNDAANVLAECVSGNIDEFVKLMNNKALQIGCKNTHFANPHGFHENDHYTTAYDLTLIFNYAIKNDIFKNIISTKEYTINETNLSPARRLINTNKMINESSNLYYKYLIGGKTGYTDEAMGTFISFAKKDNINLISCVLGAPQGTGTNEYRFTDTKHLLEYGFTNFNNQKILDKNAIRFEIKDPNVSKKYKVEISNDVYLLIKNDKYIISYLTDIFNTHNKNICTSDIVGNLNISLYFEDGTISRKAVNLICTDSSSYIDTNTIFKIILSFILLAMVILLLVFKLKLNLEYHKRSYKCKRIN